MVVTNTGGMEGNISVEKQFGFLNFVIFVPLENLRGWGKFSKMRNISDSDIPPANAPSMS
jgi:hypothetical protein